MLARVISLVLPVCATIRYIYALPSLQKEHEQKKAEADRRWKEDVDAMNARQAAEYQWHVCSRGSLDPSPSGPSY